MLGYSDIQPEWLRGEIPDDARPPLYALLDFFLVNSPCRFQSSRRRGLEEWGWEPGMWLREDYLKRRIDAALFGSFTRPLKKVRSRAELLRELPGFRLDDSGFPGDLGDRALFVVAPHRGNSSEYMSLFYHIRNALAHGRFAIAPAPSGSRKLLFEDGRAVGGNARFELAARGVLDLNGLAEAIGVIKCGPDQPLPLEQAFVAAISAGCNTKKMIKEELELGEDDWRVSSRCLKDDGVIEFSRKGGWRLASR